MHWHRHASIFILAAGALAGAACSSDHPPALGSSDGELTTAQCSFFAEGDKVQICHRTGSARNPYTVIRTNIASCGGHAGHAGDYITSTNPADPEYDPTCNGQGCFPEGAPFDGSVECCAGLTPVNGVCADIDECATNNGGCGAGFTCADGANPGDAPTCTNVDECAPSPCQHGGTCTDGVSSFTCACAPGYEGPTCATNIDDCAGSPCNNGGTCTDGVNSFTCSCANGYAGPTCDTPPPICGNGAIEGTESCDDGNAASGDGCSATCGVEAGFGCSGTPSACGPICGDGIRAGGEQCDDGDLDDGDGCSATCTTELVPGCGNGILELPLGEQCDDGNAQNGDGCSATCTIERCGDGTAQPGEACDDGNATNGDGCSTSCAIECNGAAFNLAHQWTFNDGTARDIVSGDDGVLHDGATIASGALVLDNAGTTPGQALVGQRMTARLSDSTPFERTIVAWVHLADWNQLGGSPLSIQDSGGVVFDGIVYGERTARQWMAGSNDFLRTPPSNGGAAEGSSNLIQVAIVYGANDTITLYRNGQPYGNTYSLGPAMNYGSGASDALLGLRHTFCHSNCWFSGSVDEARIYDVALDACQIAALEPVPQPECPKGGSAFGDGCYVARDHDVNHDTSEATCVADYGGHLASVHSQAENAFIADLFDPYHLGSINEEVTARIGGISAPSGACGAPSAFTWTDGTPWDYTNWRLTTGEPNGCGIRESVQLWPPHNGFYAGWNDADATHSLGMFVCKYPKP
jgi:cysteine-rich repeat protein